MAAEIERSQYSPTIEPTGVAVEGQGQQYVSANEDPAASAREQFIVDPDTVDRSNAAHARTQNALADRLSGRGIEVLSPRASDSQYDAAGRTADVFLVAEVKSLTLLNEERQLRLGLGQLLRYVHMLRVRELRIQPVLAVEREPSDTSWIGLRGAYGVQLTWPPDFPGLGARLVSSVGGGRRLGFKRVIRRLRIATLSCFWLRQDDPARKEPSLAIGGAEGCGRVVQPTL